MTERFFLGDMHTMFGQQITFDVLEVWLDQQQPEMRDWLNDNLEGKYEIVTELSYFDYDSVYATYAIHIVYDDERDALHHKMRWPQ